MLKKISFGQNKRYKKCTLFFFRELQLISVLLLICDSYISWSTSLVSLKLWVGFSIFDSVSFLLKFIFLSTKCMDSLTLKCHYSFQNHNNKKSTHSLLPDVWFLSCNKKFWNSVVLKFSFWISPKTDLVTNFLNLKSRSFENVSFSQLKLLSTKLTFLYLISYLFLFLTYLFLF